MKEKNLRQRSIIFGIEISPGSLQYALKHCSRKLGLIENLRNYTADEYLHRVAITEFG